MKQAQAVAVTAVRRPRGGYLRALAALLAVVVGAGSAVVGGAGAAVADSSYVVSQHWLTAREVDLTVYSAANAKAYPVRLLVPPDWSPSATRTWPVLYLMHGGNDDYTSWTRETDIAEISAQTPALIVMPEAGRDGNFTDWYQLGGPGSGKWETFHVTELWNILRSTYHASDVRSIAGISSGGYGAIIYAERHPGTFKFAAAYSGPLNIFDPVLKAINDSTLRGNQDDPNALWGSPVSQSQNWREHDPLSQAVKLRGTKVYLSSGTTGLPGDLDPNDSWQPLQLGEAVVGSSTTALRTRLSLLGIPATVHQYQLGTHSWPYWQRELHTSWPQITASLGLG
jgi:diacylglycerol O-acyltransferase/trehalose O-mycolyltransferase